MYSSRTFVVPLGSEIWTDDLRRSQIDSLFTRIKLSPITHFRFELAARRKQGPKPFSGEGATLLSRSFRREVGLCLKRNYNGNRRCWGKKQYCQRPVEREHPKKSIGLGIAGVSRGLQFHNTDRAPRRFKSLPEICISGEGDGGISQIFGFVDFTPFSDGLTRGYFSLCSSRVLGLGCIERNKTERI